MSVAMGEGRGGPLVDVARGTSCMLPEIVGYFAETVVAPATARLIIVRKGWCKMLPSPNEIFVRDGNISAARLNSAGDWVHFFPERPHTQLR